MKRILELFGMFMIVLSTGFTQDFRRDWPRVMVIFDEKIDGDPVDARIVATRIEEIFLEKGFRLVDKSQFEAVTSRDIALAESNPMRAKEIGLRYGAEWIVVGKVEANFDAEKTFYGMKNYEYASKGTGKVIITDTGEMIAVTSKNTKKNASGRSSAANTVLTALGELIASDLYVKARVRIKEEESGPRFLQIAILGVDDKTIAQLEKSIPQDVTLINYMKLRYFEKDGAVFDVNFNGTIDDLRGELGKRQDLAVIGFTGSRVDISTKANAEKAKAGLVTSPLEITEFKVENVFPSQVNYYAYNPLATLEVENGAQTEIRNVKVSLFVPGYMALPSEEIVPMVAPGAKQSFKLSATFDAKQLYTLNANTTGQAKVELSYVFNGQPQTRSLVRPVTIYNRNTISWRRGESVGSFITDTDDAVVAFSRYVVGNVGSDDLFKNAKLPRPVVNALAVWNGIRASGINYVSDPWKSAEGDILDQIQYPRETLASKTGDCDDSSVLLAAALENIGIRTKLIGTSDHIFMMFDTELTPKNGYLLSLDEKEYVVHEGAVWIPLETTMINEPFTKAWRVGAQEYHKHVESGSKLEIIDVRKAKEAFPPANLPATARPGTPSAERIIQLASADLTDYDYHQSQLVGNTADRISTSTDPVDKNKAAVIYAKGDNFDAALASLSGVGTAAAYNTIGNIYLLKNELPTAQEYYQKALELTTDDGGVYMNFGLARYLAGSTEDAVESFQVAISKFESREQALEVLGLERINEVLGTRAAGKSEVQVSRSAIFALISRSLQNVPEKGRSTAQATRVREKYKDEQNKYVFGGRRGADPTQIASIKEFLYWKE